MISGEREAAEQFALDANGSAISPRLLDLRRKIHSKEYLNNAIQRIAQVISKRLVESHDELQIRN